MHTKHKPRFRFEHATRRLIPIQELPYGCAFGSFDMRSRGHSLLWANITCWPKSQQHVLYEGSGTPRPVIQVRGVPLWSQELAVYLTERKKSIGAMIEELGLMKCLPRRSKAQNNIEPLPEDFTLTQFWHCKRCSWKWPQDAPTAPARCVHCNSGWWQFTKKELPEEAAV